MPQIVNSSIEAVKSEDVRGRLTAIQESVLELDQEISNSRKQIDEKRGIVNASKAIGDRVFQECNVVQKKIDEKTIEIDEARIRIDQIQRIVYIIREIQKANETEFSMLRGKIVGLEKAADYASKRFEDTRLKYERHQRMEEEEEDRFKKTPSGGDVVQSPIEQSPVEQKTPPVTLFEGKVGRRGKKKKGT